MNSTIISAVKAKRLQKVAVSSVFDGYAVTANLPLSADLRQDKDHPCFDEYYRRAAADAMDTIDFNVDGFTVEDFRIGKKGAYEFTLVPVAESTMKDFISDCRKARLVASRDEALIVLEEAIYRISDYSVQEEAIQVFETINGPF